HSVTVGYHRYRWTAKRQQGHSCLQCVHESDFKSSRSVVPGAVTKLTRGKISKLADHERKEELKRNLGEPTTPLLKEVRELILGKCAPDKEKQVRAIFLRSSPSVNSKVW